MKDKITLTIADDHAVVRKGLSVFMATATDIEVLDIGTCGADAVRAVKKYAPDVVLLDLLMPDQPAVETVRQIKKISPRSQIVMLTSHEGEEYVVPVMQAGAISYILKDSKPEELIVSVRKAAIGESTISQRIAKALMNIVSKSHTEEILYEELTAREMEVLQLIAEGMSNMNIGIKLSITEKTVKSHVSNILSKLYLTDRTQAAVYAWRKGLVK
jgi:two-component system, NarL family, response regulator LiaR